MSRTIQLFAAAGICAVALSACGGGSSSIPTVATAAPATQSSVVSTPLSAANAQAPVPAVAGISGSITVPLAAGVSANVKTQSATVAPASVPALQSAARTVKDNAAGVTTLLFEAVQFDQAVTLNGHPVFSFTLPSSSLVPNAQYYMAFYDPTVSTGWMKGIEGPAAVSGTSVTFTTPLQSLPVSVKPNVWYYYSLYAIVSTTAVSPSPTPSATAVPSNAPSASPTPSVAPSTAPSVMPSASPTPSIAPSASPTPSIAPSAAPTPVVTPAPTPTPVVTPAPTPTAAPTATPTPTPTPTPVSGITTNPSSLSISIATSYAAFTVSEANNTTPITVDFTNCFGGPSYLNVGTQMAGPTMSGHVVTLPAADAADPTKGFEIFTASSAGISGAMPSNPSTCSLTISDGATHSRSATVTVNP